MEVEVDYTLSAQENANAYYTKAKKLMLKREGAKRAIKNLEKRLAEAERSPKIEEHKIVKIEKREWYEKFHWFFASDGSLAIGGRDARQNELVNSRYFEDRDLFFHADIFGGSVVVLKDGANSGGDIREEVAQFAACYSRAWEQMLHSIDVYAMRREQVGKETGKGSLGTGSFSLKGEREWHKNMALDLVMFTRDGRLNAVPYLTFDKLRASFPKYCMVRQGNDKKSDAAKKISAHLGYADLDYIIQQLPAGTFRIENRG